MQLRHEQERNEWQRQQPREERKDPSEGFERLQETLITKLEALLTAQTPQSSAPVITVTTGGTESAAPAPTIDLSPLREEQAHTRAAIDRLAQALADAENNRFKVTQTFLLPWSGPVPHYSTCRLQDSMLSQVREAARAAAEAALARLPGPSAPAPAPAHPPIIIQQPSAPQEQPPQRSPSPPPSPPRSPPPSPPVRGERFFLDVSLPEVDTKNVLEGLASESDDHNGSYDSSSSDSSIPILFPYGPDRPLGIGQPFVGTEEHHHEEVRRREVNVFQGRQYSRAPRRKLSDGEIVQSSLEDTWLESEATGAAQRFGATTKPPRALSPGQRSERKSPRGSPRPPRPFSASLDQQQRSSKSTIPALGGSNLSSPNRSRSPLIPTLGQSWDIRTSAASNLRTQEYSTVSDETDSQIQVLAASPSRLSGSVNVRNSQDLKVDEVDSPEEAEARTSTVPSAPPSSSSSTSAAFPPTLGGATVAGRTLPSMPGRTRPSLRISPPAEGSHRGSNQSLASRGSEEGDLETIEI